MTITTDDYGDFGTVTTVTPAGQTLTLAELAAVHPSITDVDIQVGDLIFPVSAALVGSDDKTDASASLVAGPSDDLVLTYVQSELLPIVEQLQDLFFLTKREAGK